MSNKATVTRWVVGVLAFAVLAGGQICNHSTQDVCTKHCGCAWCDSVEQDSGCLPSDSVNATECDVVLPLMDCIDDSTWMVSAAIAVAVYIACAIIFTVAYASREGIRRILCFLHCLSAETVGYANGLTDVESPTEEEGGEDADYEFVWTYGDDEDAMF